MSFKNNPNSSCRIIIVEKETIYENKNNTVIDFVKSNLCLQFDSTMLHKDIKGNIWAPKRNTKNSNNGMILRYMLKPISISKINIDLLYVLTKNS